MNMASLRWILLAAGALLVLALLAAGLLRGRQAARASAQRDARRGADPALGELPEVAEAASLGLGAHPEAGAAGGVAPANEPAIARPPASGADAVLAERPSIADWPPAEQRIICSLRVVSANQERLSGRRLRQGLQGAGFMHGDLAIYHLPGRPDRAMLSAANLAQPGQLDPGTMDYQRFAGLHLFTVLPGRVSAATALSQLYAVTAELARRVDGRVQDEAGQPLDPTLVDGWLRRQLAVAEPTAPGAAAAG